jgi:hypothetical protein
MPILLGETCTPNDDRFSTEIASADFRINLALARLMDSNRSMPLVAGGGEMDKFLHACQQIIPFARHDPAVHDLLASAR